MRTTTRLCTRAHDHLEIRFECGNYGLVCVSRNGPMYTCFVCSVLSNANKRAHFIMYICSVTGSMRIFFLLKRFCPPYARRCTFVHRYMLIGRTFCIDLYEKCSIFRHLNYSELSRFIFVQVLTKNGGVIH